MTRLGEAVEALARALGLWWSKGAAMPKNGALTLTRVDDEFELRTWDADPDGAVFSSDSTKRTITPHEAMIWLRCYLLGTTRVRCPDCASRGGPMEWCYAYTPYERDRLLPRQGWTYHRGVWVGGFLQWAMTRSCPTCTPAEEVTPPGDRSIYVDYDLIKRGFSHDGSGTWRKTAEPTGHVDRSWAQVFLRAMPTPAVVSKVAEHWGNVGQAMAHLQGETVSETPGDADARGRLTRLADQLQAQALEGLGGDSPEQHPDLGVWLALWLGQVPCESLGCEGGVGRCVGTLYRDDEVEARRFAANYPQPTRVLRDGGAWSVYIDEPCPRCAGSGLALGSHDAAMADAALALAEGLTAQAVAS